MKVITKSYKIGDFSVSKIFHQDRWWKIAGSYSDPAGMFRSDEGLFEFLIFGLNPADELAELLEKNIPSYFVDDKFNWQKEAREMFKEIFLIEDSLKHFEEIKNIDFEAELSTGWVNKSPSQYIPTGHKGLYRNQRIQNEIQRFKDSLEKDCRMTIIPTGCDYDAMERLLKTKSYREVCEYVISYISGKEKVAWKYMYLSPDEKLCLRKEIKM